MHRKSQETVLLDTPYKKAKHHVKGTLFIGLVIFTPFALTIWILYIVLVFVAGLLTKPATLLADLLNLQGYIQVLTVTVSAVLTVVFIYLLGLFSTTFLGRRLIASGERALRRIPGGEFIYGTIKQILDLFTMARESKSQQRVVLIEFPRKDVFSVAFFSGVTIRPDTGEPLLNIFYATTPNPTTGFLMLMRPEEVWETNLTFAEATRFIMSGGAVELEKLEMRPFPLEEYLKQTEARRRAKEEMERERLEVTDKGIVLPRSRDNTK
jgi:uncharacterized membrane protein